MATVPFRQNSGDSCYSGGLLNFLRAVNRFLLYQHSMPIPVPCACGKQVAVPDKYAGKKIKCPSCGQAMRVPAAAGVTPQSTSKENGTIAVQCPCGRSVAHNPSLAGKTVKCPGCGQPLGIPVRQQMDRVSGPPQGTVTGIAPGKPAGGLDDLLDEIGLSDGSGDRCPNCRAEMPEDAVVCVQCGFNVRAGRKMDTKRPLTAKDRLARASKRSRSGPKKSGSAWAMPLIVGGLFLVAVGIWPFYPEASLRMVQVVSSIAMFVGAIWLVVIAFHVSPLEGLLCLVVPFYTLVFAIRHWELSKTPMVLQISGLLGLGFYFS